MIPAISEPTTHLPDHTGAADSPEAISLDWEQAVRIATLLLYEHHEPPELLHDPAAAAEILTLAALLCAYGVLPEEHGRMQALADYVVLGSP